MDLLVFGASLGVAVLTGVIIHETLHLAVLRLGGIESTVEFDVLRGRASVRPTVSPTSSHRVLQTAAAAPLLLVIPAGGWVALGGAVGPEVATAVPVGWLACALPSPRDFTVIIRPGTASSSSRAGGTDS